MQELSMQCDSCAVVSSSGQLVNSSAGKFIDSYPCVIRMNSAPTSGFEKDVGSRTTARVMGHVNLKKINSSLEEQEEIFINSTTRTSKMIIPWLFGVKSNKRRDKYYLIAKNFSEVFPSTEFYILSSRKMMEAESIFQAETGISRYSRQNCFSRTIRGNWFWLYRTFFYPYLLWATLRKKIYSQTGSELSH